MDGQDGSDAVAASLAGWLDAVTFVDRAATEVTPLLVDSIVDWATGQGWRVYRRAPSVVSLPPPYQHRRSSLDVACARPLGAPIAIEVDRSDRQRTIDKLLAESDAGRIAIWVRWGSGGFTAPPLPVRMVTVAVSHRRGSSDQGRLFSRLPSTQRPAPPHTPTDAPTRQEAIWQTDPG
jgi:hypothetical protein